jgi:hypothetical protein
MVKTLLVLCAFVAVSPVFGTAQPTVRVEPSNLKGPRVLEEQTAKAAVRDYLQAWQSLRSALEQNRADLLDSSFVGSAKDKLADTINQQSALGMKTNYQDRAHDIQIVFYSPEGLSIEMEDNVEYDVEIVDHDKVQATRRLSARYVVVMSPAEVRWRVRVFQALPQ